MTIKLLICFFTCILWSLNSHAQGGEIDLKKQQSILDKNFSEKKWLKAEVGQIADTALHGRGYVHNGRESASAYIQKRFKDFKLKTVLEKTYAQGYAFPVNTFPGNMQLSLNGKELVAGEDYIIEASSNSYSAEDLAIKRVDMFTTDTVQWRALWGSFTDSESVYILENIDSACRHWHVRKERFLAALPKGCYIISVAEKDKLIWTVSRDSMQATVFYVKETAIPDKEKSATVQVTSKYYAHARSENIIGYVPGRVKDTFIAFTAHYDHLGMMGEGTIFPGASDNASGTAMMLYLADYFSVHPQKYSMLFIAFSGEEAGLMGSTFFTQNPIIPLKSIKFLTNIDIMGDATQGITVVNATEFPQQFDSLVNINNIKRYVPEVKSRGKTQNSDHFHFFEKGVPCFYIYSNGGKGYYHDIHDNAEELTLRFIDGVAKLLVEFTENMR